MNNKGIVKQIIGPVVDVEFSEKVPELLGALEVSVGDKTLTLEVEQHLGEGMVRTVAMGATEGLKRGTEVNDLGSPITVPVGNPTLGRMFDVLGNPIDGKEQVKGAEKLPIHRDAPAFSEQSKSIEIF